ncbi:MAG: phosphoribosylglycinamide formyltransferase 2, partial [Demequina sp.]
GIGLPDEVEAVPAASCAVLAEGSGVPVFGGVDEALAVPEADLRLFGKPRVEGRRRVAATVARGASVGQARERARAAAAALAVDLV